MHEEQKYTYITLNLKFEMFSHFTLPVKKQ